MLCYSCNYSAFFKDPAKVFPLQCRCAGTSRLWNGLCSSTLSSCEWGLRYKAQHQLSKTHNQSFWSAARHVLWGAAKGSGFLLFGEKKAEGQPQGSLLLPEEGMWRGRGWSLLPDTQWQDVWEWFKAASREVQTGCSAAFLYREGGQTLEQAS